MGFPRQEYWSGLPFPPPGDVPDIEIKPVSPGSSHQFSSVQLLSRVRLSATPRTAARQASLSITNSQSPPKPMSIESSDAIQPSHPLSSTSPPAPNPSQHQGLFHGVRSSHEVAKVLKFSSSASVLPMDVQDWFPLGLTG